MYEANQCAGLFVLWQCIGWLTPRLQCSRWRTQCLEGAPASRLAFSVSSAPILVKVARSETEGFNFPNFFFLRYNDFMARLEYWAVPDEWWPLIEKILKWNNRFQFVSIRRSPLLSSRRRRRDITLRSIFPLASQIWSGLTTLEKDAWTTAGTLSKYSNFQTFLRDLAGLLRNEMSYPGTPNPYVQDSCGRGVIGFPASGFLLKQEHPYNYYVLRKVRGTRSQYEPHRLIESFGLPMDVAISYRSDLTAINGNALARFRVVVWSNYQGRDIYKNYDLDFDLSSEWTRLTLSISTVKGILKGYTAYIDVQECSGVLDWDNVLLKHSGVNWARDFRCNAVSTSYTGSFFEIARNWEADVLPPGAFYGSVYYNYGV